MNGDQKERKLPDETSYMYDAGEEGSNANSFRAFDILEQFPYLRNNGLRQIQAQQQGVATNTNVHRKKGGKETEEKKSLNVCESLSHVETGNNVKLDCTELNTICSSSSNILDKTSKRTAMEKRPKVAFVLKGKLGHDMDAVIKSVRQILIEPVDTEERIYEEFVYNYSKEIKKEPVDAVIVSEATSGYNDQLHVPGTSAGEDSQHSFVSDENITNLSFKGVTSTFTNTLTKSMTSITNASTVVRKETNENHAVRYTEPSLAEIRASVLGSTTLQSMATFTPNFIKTEQGKDFVRVKNNDVGNIDDDNESFESDINESKSNENWFNVAVKNYNSDTRKSEELLEFTPSAKKGGRSDPENPFALTSPSFNDSTAKALMTTTQTSTATIVMISIMSIGSRSKLVTNIVNSKAAKGGIISVMNPIEPPGNKSTQVNNEDQISSETTPIMSKLKRERRVSSESTGASGSNIDRLDVNITIDDEQYVGHGENKRWLCKICPKSYTTKHNLVAHILDHGDVKPHLCLLCGKYFKQLSHLNTHMLTHDKVKPYVCTQCDKGFTQISHLKRHETVHMGSKPYICDICNRGFAYPSELRIHKEKHIVGSEKCPDCNKEFETWDQLHEHMITSSHGGDLKCKHCERIFRYPSQLRDHMLSHAGSRPFICTECGMDFMKEHHLKSHLFTHTGLRPYSCPECGRSFNQKANMQRHMLIHNAERAYKCEVCGKTFTQPQTLKAHMVVHSDTKPYKCNICGKQFGRQHNLQGHMHIHSDSKPYNCSICQASFTLKGNLNRHKKVKHGLDESTEAMEEDAVNFLSTISDRTRENYFSIPSDNEMDQDSRDSLSSPDSRSSRKGRKSVPRKHVSRPLYEENDAEKSNDIDTEQMITYSDEERENERTKEFTSKYFEQSGSGIAGSRRKRKRGVVYHVENDDDDDESDDEVKVEDSGSSEIIDVNKSSPNETRSVRKRKKKDYGEDFTETGYDLESSRSQKKKSAKLDNIIATKFSM